MARAGPDAAVHHPVGSANATATALGVTDNIFRVGDVVRITSTGEAVEITATAAGAVTATRAIGVAVTAGVTAANAAELFIVGNVNAEGAGLREIKTPATVFPFNYCEIVRTPTGLTGTDAATSPSTETSAVTAYAGTLCSSTTGPGRTSLSRGPSGSTRTPPVRRSGSPAGSPSSSPPTS